ncbi:MAG TPA: hypothetical protein VGE47_02215 [Burkholderiaceae bacterium]
MTLNELRGPQDAAESHQAWREIWAALLRLVRRKRADTSAALALYGEACAPEGALPPALE